MASSILIEYKQFLNRFNWNGTLTGTTTPGQSVPKSYGNERELHNPHISRTGALPSDWFGSVGFYGISTFVGYLIPNSFYTYILDTYDL